ncbi:MAG: hypothetical protein DBY22_00915, partial [Clostridiales bacterium]
RLYCRLTSFSRSLQTILRIILDSTEYLLRMSALRQAFFNAQKFEKKQGLRVPKSNAADIYKIDANPVE